MLFHNFTKEDNFDEFSSVNLFKTGIQSGRKNSLLKEQVPSLKLTLEFGCYGNYYLDFRLIYNGDN